MEKYIYTQSNYNDYYNTIQLVLPLDIGIKIDPDDEVVSFQKALEGVNLHRFLKRQECRGRKGYDKVMLLKVILFARMIGESNLRKIESLCKNDIRFLYLSEEERPSFMVFERLMKNYLIYDIDEIFFEVSLHISDLMGIDRSKSYTDGTKLEANANKYSFVYKKRILNSRMDLFKKITESIIIMNMNSGYNFKYSQYYCSQEIGYIVQYLMEVMIHENIELAYGKGKRKHPIQRQYDICMAYYTKLMEYEY